MVEVPVGVGGKGVSAPEGVASCLICTESGLVVCRAGSPSSCLAADDIVGGGVG